MAKEAKQEGVILIFGETGEVEVKHEENMSGARANRPGRVGAELAADDADRPTDDIEPLF
jgi:hypothetical protein